MGYNKIEDSSSSDQLDKVLENPNGIDVEEVKKQVFAQKPEDIESGKEKLFKDLAWYIKIAKKPIIVLAFLEILLYFLSLIKELKILVIDIIDPILLLVDFIFFGWVFVQVRNKYREGLWQGLVSLFFTGFGLGLVMSIFKMLWFREFWSIFNLIVEPVYMGVVAVVVGLIVSLFMIKKK